MRKVLSFILFFCMCSTLWACVGNKNEKTSFKETNHEKRVLVVFFSRTGENYAVGNIKKGNTHFIADMIAEELGGELFQIKPNQDYPIDYSACTIVAKEEKE